MLKIHHDMVQGSDEWLQARCGILTASEMCKILTPTLKVAANDKERAHLYELLAQRITGHVEPNYVSDDMLRGSEDEVEARILYAEHYAPVTEVGFMTRDFGGFTIGYSPDGLVGDDGLIEAKSRRMKFQVETILSREMPIDYSLQCQTGLLVSARKWLDFISFCAGLPMFVWRVYPDVKIQTAILEAAGAFEGRMTEKMKAYNDGLISRAMRLIPTERRVEQEIFA
jgi:YqaJ-like recombinase protein